MKKDSERGFKCTCCGEGKLEVNYTLPTTTEVRRIRNCKFCGYKFETRELSVEALEKMIADARREGYEAGIAAASKVLKPIVQSWEEFENDNKKEKPRARAS